MLPKKENYPALNIIGGRRYIKKRSSLKTRICELLPPLNSKMTTPVQTPWEQQKWNLIIIQQKLRTKKVQKIRPDKRSGPKLNGLCEPDGDGECGWTCRHMPGKHRQEVLFGAAKISMWERVKSSLTLMLVWLSRLAKGDPDPVGDRRSCTNDWRRSQKIHRNAETGHGKKGDELKGPPRIIGHQWGTIFIIPMSGSRYR